MSNSSQPERRVGYVPDLDVKLDYLVRERGGHGLDEHGRRTKAKISVMQDLADTLGVNNGNVTRWRQESRIPHLAQHILKIAVAFDIDGGSFRNDSFVRFKQACELNRPSWGRLLFGPRTAVDFTAIKPIRSGPSFDVRIADLEGYLDDEPMPLLTSGETFEVEFTDHGCKNGRSAWANWHVLIFSGDRGGYLTLMPRHRQTEEFRGADRFPVQFKSLTIPQRAGQRLKVGPTSFGEHEVVLVLTRDPVPPEMEAVFCTSAKNKELEPSLDELATWLESRLGGVTPEAAVVRAPYFVGPIGKG